MIQAFKEFLYQHGVWKPTRLPAYVVSIGNLSFGGTGKSPLTMLLAEMALPKVPTAVLSRGYKRKSREMRIVAPGATLPGPGEIGDEPWMMKTRLPQLGLLVHKDRVRMASRHWKDLGSPALVLLDDAFQHWRAYRDFDVVMIDAFEFTHGRKFLSGREGLPALGRADLVIITRSDAVTPEELITLRQKVRLHSSNRKKIPWKPDRDTAATILTARYEVDSYWSSRNETAVPKPTGKKFLLMSGIAKPESFRFTARQEGLLIEEELYFPDHHVLSSKEESVIVKRMQSDHGLELLVNEKDWARWHQFFTRHRLPVTVMKVKLSFSDDDTAALRGIVQEILRCSTSV